MKEKLINLWNKFDEVCDVIATWVIVIVAIIIITSIKINMDKEIIKEAIKEVKTEQK